jgi:hypothetical protein
LSRSSTQHLIKKHLHRLIVRDDIFVIMWHKNHLPMLPHSVQAGYYFRFFWFNVKQYLPQRAQQSRNQKKRCHHEAHEGKKNISSRFDAISVIRSSYYYA